MGDGKVVFDIDLDSKNFDKQIAEAEYKLDELIETYKILKKSKPFEGQEKQLVELEAQIENTNNHILDLKSKTINTGNESGKSFDKLGKKIKRFALSLFSVASVYSLISRASSTYLSENKTTANKIEAIWKTLGQALGPVIDYIVDGFIKLLGYVGEFVKVLTDGKVDLTKMFNKNAKSINKTSKAQKELNKQLYSFDKINKLSSSSSAGASTSKGQTNFQMPELNTTIVKKLQDLANILKENWDWIWKVGAAFGIIFGVAKITNILDNISKLLGSSGLGGLATSLSGLTTIGAILITITMTKQIFDDIKELKNEINDIIKTGEKTQENWLKNETNLNKVLDTQNVNRTSGYQTLKDSKNIFSKITGLSESQLKTAESMVKNSGKQLDAMKRIIKTEGATNDEKQKTLESWLEQYVYIQNVRDELVKNKQSTEEVDKVADQYVQSIKNAGTELGLNNDELDNMITNMSKTNGTYGEVYDKIKQINATPLKNKTAEYKIQTTSDTTKADKSMKTFFGKTAKSVVKISAATAGIVGGLVSGGAVGGLVSVISAIWNKKLAVGGIVNNPGKGVFLGGAITGESGKEGVLPLTNPNTMRELGAEIGKYITINAIIDNYMDGTKFNRSTARVQKIDNFINNR